LLSSPWGRFFEFYDLFFTGYIAPGLLRSGNLTPTTPDLFGTTGIAGFVADRFGWRTIFTYSLPNPRHHADHFQSVSDRRIPRVLEPGADSLWRARCWANQRPRSSAAGRPKRT
jgi:hypothetical protein